MAIRLHQCHGSSKYHCDLSVSCAGMTVTVGAGSFSFHGEDFTLADDTEYVVATPAGTSMVVFGYVVKERSSGQAAVFVDDYYEDGVDEKYEFTSDGDYELLHSLFQIKVPDGTTSLDDADVFVTTLVVPPDPEE